MRALTPITLDTLEEGEAFAATQPALPLSWLHLPYLDVTPEIPAPAAYRQIERTELWRVATPLDEPSGRDGQPGVLRDR